MQVPIPDLLTMRASMAIFRTLAAVRFILFVFPNVDSDNLYNKIIFSLGTSVEILRKKAKEEM